MFNFFKTFTVYFFVAQLLFLSLLILFGGFFFSSPEGEVEKADIIVILGGGTADRLKKGIELYKQDVSKRVLITGFPGLTEEAMPAYIKWRIQYLLDSGIPKKALIMDGSAASSTEEAVLVKDYLITMHIRKALIVSDPPHLRRLSYIYSSEFLSNNLSYSLIASDPVWWDPGKWWNNKHSAQFVLMEVIKCVYFIFSEG